MSSRIYKKIWAPGKWQELLGTIFVQWMFFAGILLGLAPTSYGEEPPSPVIINFGVLQGDWQRMDGNYVLRVDEIKTNLPVKVHYFNPKPIHVAEATVAIEKNLKKLFVRFQDREYEGSTYTLYYFAEKDALVGYYYQAHIKQTFEVFFLRKN